MTIARLGSFFVILALIAGCTDAPPTGLARQEGSGSLVVTSSPTGAAIFINRQPTGLETPATIPNVPAGMATVRLTFPGHFPFTATVIVEPFGETTTQGVLNPAPPHRLVVSVGEMILASRLDGTDLRPIATNLEARFPGLQIAPSAEHLIAYPTVWRIMVIRPGGAIRKILDFTRPRSPGNDTSDDLAWSRTGRYLLTSVWGKGIILYDAATDNYGPIRARGSSWFLHDAVFSPDERRIAFFEQESGTRSTFATLATMDADGSNAQPHPRDAVTAHHEQDLAWINNHELIWRDEQDGLHRFDLDSGLFSAIQLQNLATLRVAPDYSHYAFVARNPHGSGNAVSVVNVANASQTILPGGAWTSLAWAPSSDAIVATNQSDGAWWIRLDGTMYQIIDTPGCNGIGVIE